MKIYEVSDTTDEETYYTLGIYLSAEGAIRAIEDNIARRGCPPCGPWGNGESVELVVRARPVGVLKDGDPGETVWRKAWVAEDPPEDADNDDPIWRVTEESDLRGQQSDKSE